MITRTFTFLMVVSICMVGRSSEAMLDPGGSNSVATECDPLLTKKEPMTELGERKKAAEFILMLSYDHPIFENWINRSKNMDELESTLHLVWGYSLPIDVDPNFKVKYEKLKYNHILIMPPYPEKLNALAYDQSYNAYLTGRFQFPIDQVRFTNRMGYDEQHSEQQNSETLLLELVRMFKIFSSWEEWQRLSLEQRTSYVDCFLGLLKQAYSFDLLKDPENDLRTGKQRQYVNTISRKTLVPKDFKKHSIYVNGAHQYDVFFPDEYKKFKSLIEHVASGDNPASKTVKSYLIENMPLLLKRRIEATQAQKVFNQVIRSEFNYQDKIRHKSARRFSFGMDRKFATHEGYLHRYYTLEEMKQSLKNQAGPLRVRIRHEMNLLVSSPELLRPPKEMQPTEMQLALREAPKDFELSNQLLLEEPHKLLEVADGLKEKVEAIPNPDDTKLDSLVDVQRFGRALNPLINQLSANLSVLDTSTDESMHAFLYQSLIAKISSDSLNSLGAALTIYQGNKGHQFELLLELSEATTLFLEKLNSHLKAAQTFKERNATTLPDNVQLALENKIETLQNMLLIVQSQMLVSIDLKINNHRHIETAVQQILLQIVSLQTKKSLQQITDDDLNSLTSNVINMSTALTPKPTKAYPSPNGGNKVRL